MQNSPAFAMDADGDFVVVWTSNAQDGDVAGVYAQRFSNSGARLGGEFRVNTTTAGNQQAPAVAMDADGDFVVVWQDVGKDGSIGGIYVQRYDSAGVALGDEFQVNSTTVGDQREPSVTMDASGRFLVTWVGQDTTSVTSDVFGQIFSADGVAQGSEFVLATSTANNQRRQDAAVGAASTAFVVWDSTHAGNGRIMMDSFALNTASPPSGSPTATLADGIEDTPTIVSTADLLQGFTDPDGDTLSVINLSASASVVTDNGDGTFTITPPADASGSVTLSYTVTDDNGGTVDGSRNVTFAPTPDAPSGSATAALADGTEDTLYIVSAADLLAGFSDPDGDALSVIGLEPSDGTVADNGDGTFTITPAASFNGTMTLAYGVSDGASAIAGSQSVAFAAVNDAPTGSPTAILPAGSEDTNYTFGTATLLQGFADPDGDTLSVTGLTVSHGTIILTMGGVNATVEPDANHHGTVTLNYTVSDGRGGSLAASLGLTLAPVSDAPTGASTATLADGIEDTPYIVAAADLLQRFSDTDGDALSVINLTASQGTVADNGDGSFTIAPPAHFNGSMTLSYTVTDDDGGTVAGSRSVTFAPAPDAPPSGSATAALADGTEDPHYIVSAADLLVGFSDPDGDTMSVVNLAASHGTVADNGDGTFTITPTTNHNGAVTLTYGVSDGAATIAGSQSVTFTAVNDAPAITASAVAVPAGAASVVLTAADLAASDVDSATLTWAVTALGSGGLIIDGVEVTAAGATFTAAGLVAYRPVGSTGATG